MAERLLLVNPSKAPKKRRKNPVKKRVKTMAQRNAKQRAATRKMIAGRRRQLRQQKRITPKRRRVSSARKRRRNPIASRKSSAYRNVYRASAPRSNPVRRRRRRRNPIVRKDFMKYAVTDIVGPALVGSVGALSLDFLWANLLPDTMKIKAQNFKPVAKGLGAVAMTFLARFVVKDKTAERMGIGALAVVMHQTFRDIIATNMTNVKMDGMGYYNPALPAGSMPDMGYYAGNNMGLYAPDNASMQQPAVTSDMGYYAQALR